MGDDQISDSIISLSSEYSDTETDDGLIYENFADLARILLSPKSALPTSKSMIHRNIDKCTNQLVTGYFRRLSTSNDGMFAHILELSADYLMNNEVVFDVMSDSMNLSRNGFYYGIHEFKIKIISLTNRMEIGIVENIDSANELSVSTSGIASMHALGARAFFGSESVFAFEKKKKIIVNQYYGSVRCKKKIINRKCGWQSGDVIKIILNLRRGNIQFYLNGTKVRKTLSLENGKTFYPMIAFDGDCQYELM